MSTKDRFRTRTLVMLALALAVVALCTGCSERIDTLVRFVESRVTGEEYVSPRGQACLDAAEGLLGALEAGDGGAIVGLFSPKARAGSDDLDEQAGELVESCSGHVGYLDTHSVTRPMESEKVEDGKRRVELSTDFSFVLDGENYWCHMTLVSVNDFDEAEVGVNYPPLHPRCRCFVNPAVEDWGEWVRKRREERRQAAVSEETVARRFGASTGAGAGALNDKNDPYQKRRDTHAINYYEEVRNRNPEIEISAVSRNSGVDRDTVRIAYQHIFVDEHELDGVRRRFDPSYDMAQSWQRLRSGKGVQKHDRTLLMHEAIEARLMADGMSYESAHAEACRKGYNYQKELDEWLTGGD